MNVSNDAWFGDSIGPHQHLQIARAQALESGRFLLRATNTGISAVIEPDGRIQSAAAQFKTAVLTGVAEPRSGATPYVVTGDAPIILGALVAFALAWWRQSPRRWPQRSGREKGQGAKPTAQSRYEARRK